jgi:hypothetical protein
MAEKAKGFGRDAHHRNLAAMAVGHPVQDYELGLL